MKPEPHTSDARIDMFRNRLDNQLNQRHPLFKLAHTIDWQIFDEAFGKLYCADNGSPGKSIRLMVGLQYLQHMKDLSDEQTVAQWVENPYWQYFCGEDYFQHEPPIDASSMSRFRGRIGGLGCELLLQATIQTGVKTKAVKRRDFRRVTVATTVQEKAVSFPTDGRLLNRSRERLVRLSQRQGLPLRQSYARKGPEVLRKSSQYARARQMKRARGQVRKLRTYLGRVIRDIERRLEERLDLRDFFKRELAVAKQVYSQRRTDKDKTYSVHAPEVECISKGKAHKRYEFGVKASVATTNRSNFVVGGLALPGRPYDGHTLEEALEQVSRLTGSTIAEVFVDRGYKGHGETGAQVYISGQRRGINPAQLKRRLKRCQAIEPVIGHLKADGLLRRNYLQGRQGDEMNVLLSCAGHNLRVVLRRVGIFCANFWAWFRGLLPQIGLHSG